MTGDLDHRDLSLSYPRESYEKVMQEMEIKNLKNRFQTPQGTSIENIYNYVQNKFGNAEACEIENVWRIYWKMLLIEMLAPGTNIKAQKYCLPRVTFTLPHKKRDAARRHPADAAKDWYMCGDRIVVLRKHPLPPQRGSVVHSCQAIT